MVVILHDVLVSTTCRLLHSCTIQFTKQLMPSESHADQQDCLGVVLMCQVSRLCDV